MSVPDQYHDGNMTAVKLIEAYHVIYDVKDANLTNDRLRVRAYEALGFLSNLMVDLGIEVPERRDGDGRPPRCEAYVMHGPGHQSRTRCEETGEHEYHYARDPMSPGWEWTTKVASVTDHFLHEIPDERCDTEISTGRVIP